MLRVLLLAGALVAASPSTAAELPAPAPADSQAGRATADRFFGGLKAGRTAEAYRDLFANTLMAKKQGEVETLVGATDTVIRYLGAVDTWEVLEERMLGRSVMRQVYLLRTENGPIIWEIDFYRKPGGWTVNGINLSDQVKPYFAD